MRRSLSGYLKRSDQRRRPFEEEPLGGRVKSARGPLFISGEARASGGATEGRDAFGALCVSCVGAWDDGVNFAVVFL